MLVNFKVITKLKIKIRAECRQKGSQMFHVGHWNDKRQNDLNVKLIDVGHSNVKCLTV